jgi:hypothetical protein
MTDHFLLRQWHELSGTPAGLAVSDL